MPAGLGDHEWATLPLLMAYIPARGIAEAAGEEVLLTRLRDRDWDIPGGVIDPGETPEATAIREVWEETGAQVEITVLIGIQELELLGPRPDGHRWPYPISVQVYYLCHLVDLAPFTTNDESTERAFFAPDAARQVPMMVGSPGLPGVNTTGSAMLFARD